MNSNSLGNEPSRDSEIAPTRIVTDTSESPVSTPKVAKPREKPEIPGFEILSELGRGGMGVVYLARQISLKRLVALKMILLGPHENATLRQRFRTEAEAVARLQHPNIVQIHEIGAHNDLPYLALEYVEGKNLQEKFGHAALPSRQAAQLVETLARAMHYTHQRGILHRDLKPCNILLAADGTPKITDFGFAKLLDQGAGPTRTEALIGTPNYMSPEQATGDSKKMGVPADIYSLGAILYELLTGRPPFKGTSLMQTLEQVRTQEPIAPRRLRGPVPRDLETICLKCLEKEPAKRYPTAAALADDLHRFLEGQTIQARPIGLAQKTWRLARRRPILVTGILLTVALIGLIAQLLINYDVGNQLDRHRAEENYQVFVRHRNEALFNGLLTPDQGALFLGMDTAVAAKTAEIAARTALVMAGVAVDGEKPGQKTLLPEARKAELDGDCYALLLALASVRGQQILPGQPETTRFEEALRILDRARSFGIETRAYYLRRAYFLEKLGNQEAAGEIRERAAAVPLQSALDYFLVGEEQYRRGEWAEAKSSFNRALGLQPGHFWAQFFLSVCHLKAQQWEAAKAGLNTCLLQQPDFVWAYLFRSFANEKLHVSREAETDFSRALALNPAPDARYVLFLTRGIMYFNQNDLAKAAADFEAALHLKPGQYNAYLNLAHVHLARRRFDQADELIRKAMDLQPPAAVLAGYHIERGRRLLLEERYQEALDACEAALKITPQQALPHETRGRAFLALGLYKQAEAAFNQFLRRGGTEHTDIFRARGLARMKQGKYPEAAEDYSRALERSADGELYLHRGWAHFFADAWKLALRDFSKAIEMDVQTADAFTGRGLARVMLGNYREAVADAEEALKRQPETPEIMHNLACTYAQAVGRVIGDAAAKDRMTLATAYRQNALAMIRRTLEMVPVAERPTFWREKIYPDSALDPIRASEGFRLLAETYR